MWTSVLANHVKRHFDAQLTPKTDLQDSAVDTVWSRVIRLVKKPEPVPLTLHCPKILGRKNQLSRSDGWVSIINWQYAANA